MLYPRASLQNKTYFHLYDFPPALRPRDFKAPSAWSDNPADAEDQPWHAFNAGAARSSVIEASRVNDDEPVMPTPSGGELPTSPSRSDQARQISTDRPIPEYSDNPLRTRVEGSGAGSNSTRNNSTIGGNDTQHPTRVRTEEPEPDLRNLLQRVQRLETSSTSLPCNGTSETSLNLVAQQSGLQDAQISVHKTRVIRWSHGLDAAQSEFRIIIACFIAYTQPPGSSDGVSSLDTENETLVIQISNLLQKCKNIARSLKVGRPSRTLTGPGFGLDAPSREFADTLAVLYFQSFESTHRILHVPTFWTEYQRYWAHPESASMGLRLKVLLVVCIGSSLYKPKDADPGLRNMVHQWIYAAQMWLSGPLEKDRLDIHGLQIHCLTILAREIFSVGGDLVWMSMGSLVHRAMQIGLHRDPKYLPPMAIMQAEVRRRMWVTILEMLIQSSLDSAMPPRMSIDEFDTAAPSNINDDEICDSTTVLQPHPRSTYTMTSMQLLLVDSIPTRLRILQLLNGLKPEILYLDVLALSSEITTTCRASSSFMKEHKKHGITSFHRNLLDYLIRRFLIPLHLPFASKTRTNPLFHHSLKTSLETAIAIISPEPDDNFSALMAMGGGLFKEGLRSANTVISLELLAYVEGQRLDGTLQRSSQYRELLKQHMRDMILLSIERIRQGETNVKSHMFLSMVMAQVEALETGAECELGIARAARDSLEFCHDLLLTRDGAGVLLAADDMGLTPISYNDGQDAFGMDFNFESFLPDAGFFPKKKMKILISGAGIAGTSLALWLSKLGHDITVVERFPSLRATGLQIDLRGHGIEVMKRMGLEKSFRSKAAPEEGLQIVDKTGKRRAFFPANKSENGEQSFTTDWEIMRGDLCRILYDAGKERVKYVFGMWIKGLEETDVGVDINFSDGRSENFDLVVGADGVGSHTRKMMFGSGATDAFYPCGGGKMYVAYFTAPRPVQEGERYIATMFMATGKRGIMVRRHNPHEIQVYVGGTTDSVRLKNARRGNSEEEKEALAEVLYGAGWQTEEIVRSMKNADDFYCERLGLIKLDCWSKGRMVLIGDAAHCPSANTGMGTTSSMVGAYILAGEIGSHCGAEDTKDGLAVALKAYEEKFRPFMNQVQQGVLEDSEDGLMGSFMATPLGVGIFNYLAAIMSFLKMNPAKWMLKENVKDWDLPEYKELLRD
ncbi:Transcription factor [Lachnellula hyalina]|uniref:Transcription factor n=1 Tax=Lachnellula hyalina TaxID=1316788 RepID=A0A8H8TWJ1_9HELO|nr:Transcription factor [Lachnellula hyalina]TVY22957.1 Transcription factor [Lachnellula hyalina]